MRLYWPKTEAPSILPPGNGTWKPPAIAAANSVHAGHPCRTSSCAQEDPDENFACSCYYRSSLAFARACSGSCLYYLSHIAVSCVR